MFFTIIAVLIVAIGIYTITILSIDEFKMTKKIETNKEEEFNDVKTIEFVKDNTAYKYFLLIALCLACIYSSNISKAFLPLFKKVYYGNLNEMFLSIASIIIWIFELVAISHFAKNIFNIDLFSKRKNDTKKISLINTLFIFLLTFIPIMIISWLLGWNLKIVDDFGQKIENIKVVSVVSRYALYVLKILWATIIISLGQEGMEKIFKSKYRIPWGGIILMLTFGIVELIISDGKFKIMYFLFNLIFGIIYLLANKRFTISYFVSYILYIL